MNSPNPYPIPAFYNNYIWTILHPESQDCWVVDPGDASQVIHFLNKEGRQLRGILLTHHHLDHQGGVAELLEHCPEIPVWIPQGGQCVGNLAVEGGDFIELDGALPRLQVLRIPGHTLDHIAYFGGNWLFCGDTLFSAGCGRVFEGTYSQMHNSLMKLAALPPETQVFCAHEYTLANLAFAQVVEPNNQDISKHIADCQQLRQQHQATLPSNIRLELKINPFLRTHQPDVIASAQRRIGPEPLTKTLNPAEVFAVIRQWKNNF